MGAFLVCAVVLAGACSGDDSTGADLPGDTTASTTTTSVERPDGPAADITEELTGGNGPFMGAAAGTDLDAVGYVESEFVASGEATSYVAQGELATEGEWVFEPAEAASYRTRVLIRHPANPDDFSGTVIVEWLNVSGGIDANPDFASLEEEILRAGHAWVGVSAQLIGVEGGPVLVSAPGADGVSGHGLVALDPERYGTLAHPGDGFSFDIFTQVARAVRNGAGMGGLEPSHLLAAGESQSAIALTTYYNGVQPLTEAYDGFFVHSRASAGLPLVGPGEHADLVGAIGQSPALFRTDLVAPVFNLQAEGDVTGVLNSLGARQDDDDRFRLWEVAGTAHADAHLLGPIAELIDCGVPINDGPLHLVAKAGLRHLDEWVRTGVAPPEAPRLEITADEPPGLRRDADGIVLGGIRTPPVDVPVVVLSGDPGPNPDLICLLLGSTSPMSDERLVELHSSSAEYEQHYDERAGVAISEGFVLEDDRDALLAYADPSRLG